MKFDSYHPAINFIFFFSVLTFSFLFTQPIFLLLSYVCAFLYSTYLGRWKALILDLATFVLLIIYALHYASYTHFGVTELAVNWIGNQITLESLYAGLVKGVHLSTALMWFYCMIRIVSSDKIMYLLGKIWPKLSLFFSIFLRAVPQITERFRRVNRAQTAIGRGLGQGNILRQFINLLRVCSIVITWSLESIVDSAASMKSRGYSLKGRTAFSLYRFDNRDRAVVIVMFSCLVAVAMAIMLDQTRMYMDPEIVLNPITAWSYVFYAIYAFYCLLPMLLQLWSELRHNAGF